MDAADPGRETHARGGVPDGLRHGRRGPDRPRRGAAAGHRCPAGRADVPPVRRRRGPRPSRHGGERLPRRRRRQGRVRLGYGDRVGRPGRGRRAGPQGDRPRRPARHGGGPRDPDEPRRPDVARGGRRPRHGPPLRVWRREPRRGRRGAHHEGARRAGGRGGRRDLDRRRHRRGLPGRGTGRRLRAGALAGGRRRSTTTWWTPSPCCSSTPTRTRRLRVRANADTPEDAARARRFGAQGIGLCRTEHMFLGERRALVERLIVADRRRGARRGARRTAAPSAAGLRRTCSRPWTGCP